MSSTKVLHIIHSLTGGGAARTMIATAKYSAQAGPFSHSLAMIDLAHSDGAAAKLALDEGLTLPIARNWDEIHREMEKADIVQVNWWQHPELDRFLRGTLPPARLLGWFHVAGDRAPQVVTRQLVSYFDFILGGSTYTHESPSIRALPEAEQKERTGYVIGGADFARLEGLEPKKHSTFNVGYIGTVNPIKMHPHFVRMHSGINIPEAQFIVCGGDLHKQLADEARALGDGARFDFRGYVTDIRPVLEVLDVYGYPLCDDTYAASELNLQEAMFAGIVPVVFPYGGIRRIVEHNKTGLVVNSEIEYQQAIEWLYRHPEERRRLGAAAKEHAARYYGAEVNAPLINNVYSRMMDRPKRARSWPDSFIFKRPSTSGAEIFLDSLDSLAPEFEVSHRTVDFAEALKADNKILHSSALMRTTAILSYAGSYPDDSHLQLWTGLAHFSSGRFSSAAERFVSALSSGSLNCPTRLYWYLALAASACEDFATAQAALEPLLLTIPQFALGMELLRILETKSPIWSNSDLEHPEYRFR